VCQRPVSMGHYTSPGSRVALRHTLGRNFSLLAHLSPARRWPAPQTARPARWAPYPEPSYGRLMVCGHLLSIRDCPRDKDAPLSASYGRESIVRTHASLGLTRGAETIRITSSLFWCREFLPLPFPKKQLLIITLLRICFGQLYKILYYIIITINYTMNQLRENRFY